MIASKVSKRYAKALFGLGQEEQKVQEYGKDLKTFVEIYGSNPDFAGVISTRIFALDDRKRVLKAVLEKCEFSNTVKSFINLLLDKDRMGVIESVGAYYEKLKDEASNVARAEVVVPRALKADALVGLEKSLEALTSKKVKIEVSEDPSLIGGIVVKVGDLVLDGSIKAQLRGLRESL